VRYLAFVAYALRLFLMPGLFAGVLFGQNTAASVPLPRSYDVERAPGPVTIDGKVDDLAWNKARWTSDFVDIEGSAKPTPRYRTRVKMLWDEQYLYIAAELEEPDVKGKLTQHDSVIFHDNDFELFVKPLPATESYYEFEMNALNTGWDLFLNKPYLKGGEADNSWDIPNLKTAVSVEGTLNQSGNRDKGWTLEIALPWKAFQLRQPDVKQPTAGTMWRANFSRVEWLTGHPHEENWVWSPQGVVNMHVPEHWGYLRFQPYR
jgi:hypothetical protein